MCGISGFLSADPGGSADLEAVRRMNDAIRHRGPDAEGIWQHGPCALGHRRLSIIDLSTEANQPMCSEDGRIALVVNGEIYNFRELRKELVAKGHAFRSHSDSEVIVHLYEEYGADSSAIAMYCLARMTRGHATVALSRSALPLPRHRPVEFAARLPAGMLMRARGKYLLRRVAKGRVPEAILRRRKRGFALLLKRRLRQDLRQMIHDVLLDRTARERGLFDPAYVGGLVASLERESTNVDRIWTLLVLELWFREFIDTPRSTLRPLPAP